MNREERMASERMLPLMISMSIPTVLAQLVNLLYSVVDRIYIGHIPEIGSDALAGIGITSSIIILISAFAQFVSGGGAARAAIALGKGERRRAELLISNGFSLLILFSVLCMVAVYSVKTPLLRLIGASDQTFGYAAEYLNVYLIGTFFVQVTVGLNSFITAQGRSGIAMWSVVIGALLNIVLDPIFIFVFDMGVGGAALATVLSQASSALWILYFLFSKRATLRIRPALMKPSLPIIGSILSLGVAPFVMASTESFVGFVLNSGLQSYGGDIYVSALTVMQSAMQIVSVPLSGFTQGVMPIISYNFGAGNKARVKEAFRILVTVMFSVNLLLFLVMILFPRAVASVFASDPLLVETVGQIMPLFLAGMTIFGLQRACQNTFVSLGQAKISLFIALLRKIILLIPLALLLPLIVEPPVMGVFLAEPLADGIAAITCTVIFYFVFRGVLSKMPDRKENATT
ncbi:MAG: MATE family efflux transporter [Ruminococcaceae bacterium]|nr:MATE family efflux transporter [Oscillospiraceae bacterium]